MTVERDGSVVAAVPLSIPLEEVERQLRGRELWLHSALTRRTSLTAPVVAKEYVSGEGFHYLGRAYRLSVMRGATGDPIPELRLFQGSSIFAAIAPIADVSALSAGIPPRRKAGLLKRCRAFNGVLVSKFAAWQ